MHCRALRRRPERAEDDRVGAAHRLRGRWTRVCRRASSALSLSTPICYTCFRHVGAIVYRIHLRHEHGRKRQGRVLRPCVRHAWPDPDEALLEADRRRRNVAQLFACGHPHLLKDGDTSFKSQRKASELTVNCAELKAA